MQWIVFAAASLVLTAISWKSLRYRRSHGFYRYFAWESILALLLLNVNFWFVNPFAWNQIISWSLLVVSVIPLVLGVHALRTHGNPTKRREGDPALYDFEKTTTLVTDGIYQYIRHPLYSSLLLLAWGIYFKQFSQPGFLLAVAATGFLLLTAKADESECIQFFGEPYVIYMQKTKMFIPFAL
jgi:protein-S-isoprenylcysteine O-methyltransferase Ste14